MKRYLLGLSLLLTIVSGVASPSDINAIKILCRSGNEVTIMLEEDPVLRFDGLDLVITTHMNAVSFSSKEAQKIIYLNVDPNGISSTILTNALFSICEEYLKVVNLASYTTVSIYTIDGRLVSSSVTDINGCADITLPRQSASIYIVQTPSVSFKFQRP